MARLLPKAPEGPFEERALDGPGQPSVACPKASVRGESRVSLGKSRPLPAARPGRLGWVGLALRSCAPFSPFADRWRAAVYAPKSGLRAF